MWYDKANIILYGLLTIGCIVILILPFLKKIKYNKKITRAGKFYISIVFINGLISFAIYLINEKYKDDIINTAKKAAIEEDSDIGNAIDQRLYEKFGIRSIYSDSLELIKIKEERPLIKLYSARVYRNERYDNKYGIKFEFIVRGRRIGNVWGKTYMSDGNTINYLGIIPVSTSEVFEKNEIIQFERGMNWNPELMSLEDKIYYYFKFYWKDIVFKTKDSTSICAYIEPHTKGEKIENLLLCKEYEKQKIEKMKDK